MTKRTASETINLCGLEIEVDVEFEITSHGSSGSYWDPPEPPEFDIISVTASDTGLDLYAACEGLDLWGKQRYATGYWHELGGKFYFNERYHNHTILDSLHEAIMERFDDFTNDEPDYDYWDHSDSRGEYDV